MLKPFEINMFQYFSTEFSQNMVIFSSVGREERPNVPPPEIIKVGVEKWCYLPGVYTFGVETELKEIFSINL